MRNKELFYFIVHTGIAGGVRVLFQQAHYLQEYGYKPTIVTLHEAPSWLPYKLPVKALGSMEQAEKFLSKQTGVGIASWWETAPVVDRAYKRSGTSLKPLYYIQDVETSYYTYGEGNRQADVLATYQLMMRRVTTGTWVAEALHKMGVAATPILPFVDLVYFRRRNTFPQEGPILYCGRPEYLKNFDLFINALEEIPTRQVQMFGAYPWVREQIPNPERASYIQNPSDQVIESLYHQAGVFVLTSRHEGLGLPILEAFQVGVPVVTVNAEGNMSFCQDGENCLVAPNDPTALAQAIERIYQDENLARKLAEGGFETARKFTKENHLSSIHKVLQGL